MESPLRESCNGRNGSFEATIAPLIQHFFPDGCPDESLEEIWPEHQSRATVTSKKALESLDALEDCQQEHTERNFLLILTVACASIPGNRLPSVGGGSPLVNGNNDIWCRLFRLFRPHRSVCIKEIHIRQIFSVTLNEEGNLCVLRWLHLCLQYALLSPCAIRALRGKIHYNRLFTFALQTNLCSDASRILTQISRKEHARRDRSLRLARCYEEGNNQSVAIPSLLNLFSRLNPSCCPSYAYTSSNQWYVFTESKWEESFGVFLRAGRRSGGKRLRPSSTVDVLVSELQHLLGSDNPRFDDQEYLLGHAQNFLSNPKVRLHISLLGVSDPLIQKQRVGMPLMLYQAWYSNNFEYNGIQDPQIQLLELISSFCGISSDIGSELASFVVEHILPTWDGAADMGKPLCSTMVHIEPCRFSKLRGGILLHLEPLFVFGADLVRSHCIEFLSSLAVRWSQLDWGGYGLSHKIMVRTLEQLVKWVDDLLLRGFLSRDSEVLRVAALVFFEDMVLLQHCIAPLPSPEVMYRLLLSHSAPSIDGACQVLLKYRNCHEKLREGGSSDRDSATQVSLYNCFLADFVSLLWNEKGWTAPHSAGKLSILFPGLRIATQERLSRSDDNAAWFSILKSPVLKSYLKNFMTHARLESLDELKFCKEAYLKYLADFPGMEGVHGFLTKFVVQLQN